AMLGPLDWGPVVGGYLAALLLASAYAAIGLFISSRTDNQIVALIATALLGGILYLIGTANVSALFGGSTGGILRALGTGSRFESIERGVIDLRDLAYYLSLTALFLVLNTFSLDNKRWSHGLRTLNYRRNASLFASLIGVNLLLLNAWLTPLQGLRLDLTQQREYSLSPTTRALLGNLQEPLLIRGYISEQSHPLLNPLRPRVQDLIREYAIAGRGQVTGEVIDPLQNPELEAEANQTYGIQPVPFQVADRYQASVINSYFDILVRYGDQDVVLSFRDLIEVEPRADSTVDVRLRNLEYDLTSAIKKVVYGFQSVESVLAAIQEPVELTFYTTPNTLPAELQEAPATIAKVGQEIAEQSGGKLTFTQINPDDPAAGVTRQQLQEGGLQPFQVSLFSADTYFLHLLLKNGENVQDIYPPNDFSEGSVRTALENALKRSSSGFLKVIGLWTPPATPGQDMFGQPQQPLASWNMIGEQLAQEYTVQPVDLTGGVAPTNVDTLLVVLPQNMTDPERFAIDQYLMRGGSLIVAAGNYRLEIDPMTGGPGLQLIEGGLRDMLLHYGIDVQPTLVLDDQNQPFPMQVMRQAGEFQVQEYQAVNFPFFVDVRPDGMNREQAIVAGLPAVTLNWVSPVVLDEVKNTGRQTGVLLTSSPNSWLRTDTNINPSTELYPDRGYPVEGEMLAQPLAVVAQGVFTSYFTDKPSPFAVPPVDPNAVDPNAPVPTPGPAPDAGALTISSDGARLVVIGSGEFLDDAVLQLMSSMVQD
ncbi:MAG: Gldg family protein, partial [Chloroflexota bacterium]|nr:Gldg family protein [Chloroflexota bacterium]